MATKKTGGVVLLLCAVLSASAVDLREFCDLPFAEEYAFSTNRAALLEKLPPNSEAKFFYSVLLAQQEGRLEEARELLKRWRVVLYPNHIDQMMYPRSDSGKEMARRFFLLNYLRDETNLSWRAACYDHGLWMGLLSPNMRARRKVAVKPGQYPSVDTNVFSSCRKPFSYFYSPAYAPAFLATPSLMDGSVLLMHNSREEVIREMLKIEHLDLDWAFNSWLDDLARLKKGVNNPYVWGDRDRKFLSRTTLQQMDAMRTALAQKNIFLDQNEDWVWAYARKLAPTGEPGATLSAPERIAYLERLQAFAKTLPPAWGSFKRLVQYRLLDEAHKTGDFSRQELFREYLAFPRTRTIPVPQELARSEEWRVKWDMKSDEPKRFNLPMLGGTPDDDSELVRAYLLGALARGADRTAFEPLVEAKELERIDVEARFLSGRPVDEERARKALGDAGFNRLRDRRELTWDARNPVTFAADDDVLLRVQVKNVPSVRIVVYDIDPSIAVGEIGAEVPQNVDLDGAIPTAERTLAPPVVSPLVRYEVKLPLPEVKKPGLYVVEISGGGLSSRALVRKGLLRATERVTAAGHCFTSYDEEGRLMKDAVCLVDGRSFVADETGAVTVPFSETGDTDRKAVVKAGRRATVVPFRHRAEKFDLSMQAVLPAESFIAGEEVSLLLRAGLTICGERASLTLLEKPTVKLFFTDDRGIETPHEIGAVELTDNRDAAVRFWVPSNIRKVRVACEARLRNSDATADAKILTWSRAFEVNGFASTDQIPQVFLRRGADGYRVEVRGRQGEPLINRVVILSVKSRFGNCSESGSRLQTDVAGIVRLGFLKDVKELGVKLQEGGHSYCWALDAIDETTVPAEIHAVTGETIEINAAGYKDADLPSRDKLAPFVSLLERNALNEIVGNRLAHVREEAGDVLKVEGLPAGRYELRLRTLEKTIAIRVMTPADATAPHGWLVNGTQLLSVTPASERPLRIAEAICLSNGNLRVRLANVSPETRLHVFARRFIPQTRDADVAADYLKDAKTTPAVACAWDAVRSAYLSNRDLGDERTYILNRRKSAPRIGNELVRPSLLLTPRSTTETDTEPIAAREGEDWKTTDELKRERAYADSAHHISGAAGYGAPDFPLQHQRFLDFLAEPAKSWLNCPLSAEGVFEIPLAELASFSEVNILASDTRTTVRTRVCRTVRPFPIRDLRHACRIPPGESRVQCARVEKLHTKDKKLRPKDFAEFPAGTPSRYRTIATIGDAFRLFQSLKPDPEFEKFAFVCAWNKKTPEMKDELYRQFACHELNIFLSAHDPAYFKSVIRPHLKNKRDKDFIDRWLLGEDLSSFTNAAAYAELDVFEQVLLARRIPDIGFYMKLSAALCDIEAVKKRHPADDARLFNQAISADAEALSEESIVSDAAASPVFLKSPIAMKGMIGRRSPGTIGACRRGGAVPSQMETVGERFQTTRLANIREAVRRDAQRRTKTDHFRRPLEKTREWVETGYWKRRPADRAKNKIACNRFWADVLSAGRGKSFLSVHIADAAGSLTERLAALSLLELPFEAETETRTQMADGSFRLTVSSDRLLFRDACERLEPGETNGIVVVRRLLDSRAAVGRDLRTEGERTVTGDLRIGKVYEERTALINPTGRERVVSLYREIPEGALPIRGTRVTDGNIVTLKPYGSADFVSYFYFPTAAATNAVRRQYPVTVGENGHLVARTSEGRYRVVDAPEAVDKGSWEWISQNGTKEEILAFLRRSNLNAGTVDLSLIHWLMAAGVRGDWSFNEAVYRILDEKMIYNESLWAYAMEKKDLPRVKEYLARTVLKQMPQALGRFFESPVVSVCERTTGLFEHKEYAPLINARIHPFGRDGRAFANATFAAQYRSFLDLLAYKPALDDRDRLLAAVYLLAQDRIDEAAAFVAKVQPKEVETTLQYDYLRAYLAMSAGRVREAKKIAEVYKAYSVKAWQEKFAALLTQIAEIEHPERGVFDEADDGGAASGLSLCAVDRRKIAVASRALKDCKLTAHPVDLEMLFSRNPFLTDSLPGRSLFVRPVWETRIAFASNGKPTEVKLPKELVAYGNLLLVATAADGAVRTTLTHAFREPEVRLLRAQGRLFVRDDEGRPVPGAYVKVYARPAGGGEVRFHKDGYTDLRGTFDYASVSSEHSTPPAAFAIFVSDRKAGNIVLSDIPPPSSTSAPILR